MALRFKKDRKIVRMKRKNNKVVKIGGLLVLIVLTLFVLMLTPVFNADWIDISGTSHVKSSEIKDAISYSQGKNIFKINLREAKKNLESLPYVETASVHRHIPDGIRVSVTERVPVSVIEFGGGFAVIDKEGRLLEQISENTLGLPVTVGAKTEGLTIGQSISDKSEESAQAFKVLYEKLVEYKLYDRVTLINIKNPDNLSFCFDGNKNVVIGDGYRLDYKLMMLGVTIEELSPSEKGTITLSIEGKAIFTPEE